MRVIFMGTPEFSVPVLDALHAAHEVVCVYCQPPRPAGRGKKERLTPVHARALDLGLEVRHPLRLKSTEEHEAFAELQADVAVVAIGGGEEGLFESGVARAQHREAAARRDEIV